MSGFITSLVIIDIHYQNYNGCGGSSCFFLFFFFRYFFFTYRQCLLLTEPLHACSFGDLRYAKDVAAVCAGIIWISAFCDLCLLTSNACPTKKLHHKAINVRQLVFYMALKSHRGMQNAAKAKC